MPVELQGVLEDLKSRGFCNDLLSLVQFSVFDVHVFDRVALDADQMVMVLQLRRFVALHAVGK